MAITKLLHIKERKQGNPSAGLYACIRYILDDEKTENQIWVAGNLPNYDGYKTGF